MLSEQSSIKQPVLDLAYISSVLQAIADHSADALFVKDSQGCYVYANEVAANMTGHCASSFPGLTDDDLFLPHEAAANRAEDVHIIRTGESLSIERVLQSGSSLRHFEVRKIPHRDPSGKICGVVGIARDVTERHLFELALQKQNQILERIAKGAALHEVLNDLVEIIEAECPGVLGSFLLLESDGRTLRSAAGSSLPKEYHSIIDGIQIGPNAGSCGTAVWCKQPVRVDDIPSDPLWKDFRHVAERFDLLACWSFPILTSKEKEQQILGTFALYSRVPGVLNSRLDTAIERIENLARIAIEQAQDRQKLLDSEARFRTILQNSGDAFYLLKRGGHIVDVNDEACHQLGFSREELMGKTVDFIDVGYQKQKVLNLTQRLDTGERITFESRHRRKDGTEFPVEIRLSPFMQDGARYSVASVRNITERMQAEERLRQQQMLLEESQALSHLGSFEWDIRTNRLTWSSELYRIYGLEPGETEITLERFVSHLHPEDRRKVEGAIQAACSDASGFRTEERIIRSSGEERILTSIGKVITDEQGLPIRIIGACQDVTEQKQAAAELESSQKLVAAMAQASPLMIYVFDLTEQRILYSNFQLVWDLGYSTDEMKLRTLNEMTRLIHPDDLARFPELLKRWDTAEDGLILETEYQVLDARGQWRWIISRDTVLERDPSGKVIQLIGTAWDTTERKNSELAMRETVSRMLATLESTADGILVVDLEGRVQDFNRQFLRTWGMSADLIKEVRREDLISAFNQISGMQHVLAQLKDPEGFVRRISEIYQTPDVATFDVLEFLDGRVVERYSQPQRIDGVPVGRVWSFRDVSARRTAERSLQLTQFTVDRAVDSVFWVNPDGEILYVNEAACKTLGFERSELVGKTVSDIDPNFPADQWQAHWEEVKSRGSFTFESDHARKDGRVIQTEVTVNYLQYEGREYNCAVMRDITLRRKTEAQRDRLWNQSPDLMCICDLHGVIRQANPAWEHLLNWKEDDLKQQSWLQYVHMDDCEQTQRSLQSVVRGDAVTDLTHRLRNSKGEWHWISWNIIPVLNEEVFYAFGRDVTEARHLAEQFQQSQKMEAIGRLAGGVAHDFNNLLTVINGYAEMLLTDFVVGEPYREPVAEIKRSGERAAELTSQLLAFSRRSLIAPRILNLNVIVESTGKMLKRLIGEDIQLTIELDWELPGIVGDQGRLEQVLMNLAVNSRDAMPKGGRLSVETHRVAVPDFQHPDEPAMTPGEYVCLKVIDTGEGMSDEVRARIFEPFFTTKEIGKGTGLGLSVVHGIVSQFGGTIFVDSEQGCGTTISIYFPAAAASSEDSAETPTAIVPGHVRETVLLVEDDDAVRTITVIALENAGFRVLAAESAVNAITLARPQISQIDLLITDVVMPRMGGRELADTIHTMRPELPVLYISGYTEDAIAQDGVRTAFLQKPFTPLTLVRKAREVLDAFFRRT